MAFNANQQSVVDLFIAAYGRAPTQTGLDFFTGKLDSSEMSLKDIANYMFDTRNNPEAATRYPDSGTLDDKVNAVFNHVLGRGVATEEGMNFWKSKFDNPDYTMKDLVFDVLQEAKNNSDDNHTLENKSAVVEYFLTHVPADQQAGNQINTDSVNNDDATVTSAEAVIDNIGSGAGQVFQLTTSADSLVGTSGDDIFDGSVVQNQINGDNENTFTSIDNLDGGTGNDTLNVQLTGGTTDTPQTVGATVANIENINFTAFGNAKYDMSNTTGVESVKNISSINAVEFSNVSSNIDLTVKGINNHQTTLSYSDSANKTLTDEQNLTLSNVTNSAIITIAGTNDIETLNIKASDSASKVKVGGTALDGTTKLVITGDKDLNITDTDDSNAMAKIKTVDASAFTGGLTADLTNANADTYDIKGGSGDDKVTINTFDKNDVIDLGDGTDTLVIKTKGAESVTSAASLKNIEILNLDTAAGNLTMNASGATELTTIELGASANTAKLTKLVATANTVNFDGGGITADTALTTLSYALADATGSSDALTINYTNKDSSGNLINTTKGAQLTSTVTADGIESITINTDQLHPNSDDTTATTADGGVSITLTDNKLQTLTIASETNVKLSALDDSVKTVDASGANGGVNLDLTNAADADTTTATDKSVTVTTGNGADYIQNIKGTVNTTITTNSGDDVLATGGVIASGGKKIAIDTGAGKDSVTLSTANLFDDDGKSILDLKMGDDNDTLKITADLDGDGTTGNISGNSNLGASPDSSSAIDFGDGSDTLNLTANAMDLSNISLSGLEKIDVISGSNTVNLDAEGLSETELAINFFSNATIDLKASDTDSTIDASKIVVTGTGTLSLTGSDGTDTITAAATATTITGGAGADTITLGDGADTVHFSTESATTTYDSVSNATSGDKFIFDTKNGTSAWTSTKVTFDTDVATTLNAAAAGDGSSDSIVKWFTDGTDSYIVVDNTDGDTFAITDETIKITGVTDLSGATFDDATSSITLA